MRKQSVLTFIVMLGLSFYCIGNVQARDKFSNEPMVEEQTLQDLCEFASFSEVKDAIIAGEDVNGKDFVGRTALMAACQGNSSAEMMQLLLSYGAKVNLTDNAGKTAFMYAAQYDTYEKVFRELLKAGALVNVKSNDGTTALMLACENNKPEIVSLIIEAGADVNAKDYDGYKAVDYAKNNKQYAEEIKNILNKKK
ncbi:MAG: ankyrin repeat domain-containing protein [Elusimicrobia bacterium]|nr:ankyrin repeat domain-containing protein [Elusimicrobiota bacterium]